MRAISKPSKRYAHPMSTAFQLKSNNQPFPAVTFCNMNAFKKSALQLSPEVAQLVKSYTDSRNKKNDTATNNQAMAVKTRKKRSNPSLASCSCNFMSPVKATYSSTLYVRYPSMSVSWACSFTCCANSPDGQNGRTAQFEGDALYTYLKNANVIAGLPTWTAMSQPTSGKYYWYSDSTTQSKGPFTLASLCTGCSGMGMSGGGLLSFSSGKFSYMFGTSGSTSNIYCECK
jgi:hypothetical protein